MHVSRLFTVAGRSPYEGIDFVSRTSKITTLDGSVVFQADGVTVPSTWDQTATDVLAQKYFRRAGCDFSYEGSVYRDSMAKEIFPAGYVIPNRTKENDLRETIHRIVGCWTKWGQCLGYFSSDEDAQAFYDEMSYMIATQRFAPNSPQWFNVGLNYAYGITGVPQDYFHVDPHHPDQGSVPTPNAYTYPSSSACFILGVTDDLVTPGGIADLWMREARVFKMGGGAGSNFSAVRAAGEPLSGGGTSSGLMSFLAVNDRAAGAIKSGGTTRRAAKLVALDVDHPDIETFIRWKVVEERKAAAIVCGQQAMRKSWVSMVEAYQQDRDANPATNAKLASTLRKAVAAGVPVPFIDQCMKRLSLGDTSLDLQDITLDWEGEAYQSIGAQNSNNSVRVTDAFMEAVLNDGDWNLTRRTDGSVAKTLRARDLWKQLVHAAWACADPGLQFDTTYNSWHTCPAGGRIRSTNPCSEFAFLDNTACNLGNTNLVAFLDGRVFNVEAFTHACSLITIALEITVACSQYPSAELAQNSYDYRPLGQGFANLGALLMRLGLPYDSREGRDVAAAITSLMTGVAYGTSALMAHDLGAFPAFEENREALLRVLGRHRDASHGIDVLPTGSYEVRTFSMRPTASSATPIAEAAKAVWDATVFQAGHGVRNAQVTCLAPTGTVGIVMGCDTTGIEPDFALVKFKKLAGGGYLKQVNGSVEVALRNLRYSEEDIQDIQDYILGKPILQLPDSAAITKKDLLEHGYTLSGISTWDEKLRSSFDPSYVLPVADLVAVFGQERVDSFLLDVGGRATVEGAPHLEEDHLPIFDCANKCGRWGKRFISPMGHLMMMAACQPFLSGSISKTVNLPSTATFDDVSEVYMNAWKWGVKSIALYRDGSKFSQPLATSLGMLDGLQAMEDAPEAQAPTVPVVAEALARQVATRTRLPHRRGGYTQAASVGGTKMYLRTGEYDDGSLGEIFLDIHKEGAGYRSLLNAFAIAVSIGLQYGVPLDEFCDAFIFTKFEPNGLVRGHDAVKNATSVIDFAFRDLAISYLDRHDLAHVKPEDFLNGSGPKRPVSRAINFGVDVEAEVAAPEAPKGVPARSAKDLAREQGFTGEPCPECGHLTLVRNGTCNKCQTCGTTTGCS